MPDGPAEITANRTAAAPSAAASSAAASIRDAGAERRRWVALLIVCFAMLMNTLDQTIVNVALPSIQRDLGFSQAGLAWVLDAYLLAFGGALLLAGRLGDLIGRKKVFLAGVAVFTAASAACGAAGSPAALVSARGVQGLGAALSASVILAIIVAEFREDAERARAMSVYVFVGVGANAAGLVAGGGIAEALSWHWIFWINIPIGVLTVLLAVPLLDENPGLGIRGGVDIAGAVTSAAGVTLAIYAIVAVGEGNWRSWRALVAGGAACVLLVAFGVRERSLERAGGRPLMPPRILRSRTLLTSTLVRVLAFVGVFALFFIGPLYLQNVLGYGALRAGLAFLPLTLVTFGFSIGATTRLTMRYGPRATIVIGMVSALVGFVLFATAGEQTAYFPQLFIAFVLVGGATGMTFTPLLTIAISDAPPQDAGIATGVVNVTQQVGAALSVAVMGAVSGTRIRALEASHATRLHALTSGYRLGFVVAACCLAAALVACLTLARPAPRSGQPDRSMKPGLASSNVGPVDDAL